MNRIVETLKKIQVEEAIQPSYEGYLTDGTPGFRHPLIEKVGRRLEKDYLSLPKDQRKLASEELKKSGFRIGRSLDEMGWVITLIFTPKGTLVFG